MDLNYLAIRLIAVAFLLLITAIYVELHVRFGYVLNVTGKYLVMWYGLDLRDRKNIILFRIHGPKDLQS